jgi:hypothetical protein
LHSILIGALIPGGKGGPRRAPSDPLLVLNGATLVTKGPTHLVSEVYTTGTKVSAPFSTRRRKNPVLKGGTLVLGRRNTQYCALQSGHSISPMHLSLYVCVWSSLARRSGLAGGRRQPLDVEASQHGDDGSLHA